MVANTTLPPIVVPAGGNIPGTSCPSPNPDYFPLNSSVQASLGGVAAGTTVYLGGYLATLSAGSSGGNEGLIDIPASSISGPVDMECIDPSGYTTAIPSAISYGVQVTASSANHRSLRLRYPRCDVQFESDGDGRRKYSTSCQHEFKSLSRKPPGCGSEDVARNARCSSKHHGNKRKRYGDARERCHLYPIHNHRSSFWHSAASVRYAPQSALRHEGA